MERPLNYERSVFTIQQYLYFLSILDPDIPRVNPDGIYGAETRDAVIAFQKKYGLEPTGAVDYKTWVLLGKKYSQARELIDEAKSITPFVPKLFLGSINPGDKSELVKLIQVMLDTISIEYRDLQNIPITGTYDEATVDAIKEFQRINGIEPTGIIDKLTFNSLADAYNKYNLYE